MEQLKFELVNGYGVLVDEETRGKNMGDGIYFDSWKKAHPKITKYCESDEVQPTEYKIIFAESELGLDVPVFEWRDFEIERQAMDLLKDKWAHLYQFGYPQKPYPINYENDLNNVLLGIYKSNPARYTEEDLKFAFETVLRYTGNKSNKSDVFVNIIQSLQKCPQYVVMETEKELVKCPDCEGYGFFPERKCHCNDGKISLGDKIKLFTNSQGKQQVIVKELIW